MPKAVIIDIIIRAKAYARLPAVKRLKTGKCLKKIGIAVVTLGPNATKD